MTTTRRKSCQNKSSGRMVRRAQFAGKSTRFPVLGSKSMGPGWYWCAECREKFTVRVGSVHKALAYRAAPVDARLTTVCGIKEGFSRSQLMRTIGLGSYRSAWFMAHRIREAMDGSTDHDDGPLGGEGKIVEADETIHRHVEARAMELRSTVSARFVPVAPREMKVMTLVERGGRAQSIKARGTGERSPLRAFFGH